MPAGMTGEPVQLRMLSSVFVARVLSRVLSDGQLNSDSDFDCFYI